MATNNNNRRVSCGVDFPIVADIRNTLDVAGSHWYAIHTLIWLIFTGMCAIIIIYLGYL